MNHMWRTSAAYKVHTSDLRIVILSSEMFSHWQMCQYEMLGWYTHSFETANCGWWSFTVNFLLCLSNTSNASVWRLQHDQNNVDICAIQAEEFNQNFIDLEQKVLSQIATELLQGGNLPAKWHRHSATPLLYRIITRIHPIESRPLYQRDALQTIAFIGVDSFRSVVTCL